MCNEALDFIAVGSNIRPRYHVPLILQKLLEDYGHLHVSRIVSREPVNLEPGAGSFFNLCVACPVRDHESDRIQFLHSIEEDLGRDRSRPSASELGRSADLVFLFRHSDRSVRVPIDCIPEEPVVRPMLLELLQYLNIPHNFKPPRLQQGERSTIGGLKFGSAPLSIYFEAGGYHSRRLK